MAVVQLTAWGIGKKKVMKKRPGTSEGSEGETDREDESSCVPFAIRASRPKIASKEAAATQRIGDGFYFFLLKKKLARCLTL